MEFRRFIRRITPCSIVQWLRILFVVALIIYLSLGYGFSQVQLNVKAQPGSEALSFLQAPSTYRLPANHPLRSVSEVKPLHPLTSPSDRAQDPLKEIFTLSFPGNSGNTYRNQLLQLGEFEWVEVNGMVPIIKARVESVDDSSAREALWFHDVIRTDEAWQVTRGSSQIKIGILDTGLDYEHPELIGSVAVKAAEDVNGNGRFDPWPDSILVDGVSGDFDGVDNDNNGYTDDVIGYDFTDQPRSPFGGDYLFEDPNPLDDNDHGTLVAGIISADPNNSSLARGVAPNCELVTLRAFAANGAGEDDDIARAIVYAADNDVDILNFSFGDIYPSQMMHAAIQYAYQKGVVMVASAGNGTGDNLHYPSNFPEVISVSASALGVDGSSEFLWPLSSFGLTVDLCAPGSGILTTVVRDTLDDGEICELGIFSGTSTAAPMVSAAVGVLFAERGKLSPDAVRGYLTGSATDIANEGWDHLTGAGRLDLVELLGQVGGSIARIESPANDFGTSSNEIPLQVTVLDPEFSSFHLEYEAGTDGNDNWIPILSDQTDQVEASQVGIWDVASLADGEYTLRLRIDKTDGSTAEDRIRVVVDRSPPVIEVREAATVWDNDVRKLMVVYRNSDRGQTRLSFRSTGETDFRQLPFDRMTRNGFFVLGPELIQGDSVTFFLSTTNEAGQTASSAPQTIAYHPSYVSPIGWDTLTYSIPMGHYLAAPQDFDGDGLLEVVMSEYDDNLGFGKLKAYEYNGTQFTALDSLNFKPILIPKDIADTDNDGLLELLCSVNDSGYVIEQAAPGLFPQIITHENLGQGYFPAQFAEVNGDGQLDYLAKDLVDYRVFEGDGNGGFLNGPQLPDVSGNYIGSVAPKVLVEDFDGDGQNEIVYGDFDGDLLVYEFDGSSYQLVWTDTTSLTQTGSYLAKGDFDGDGQLEWVVGAHPSTNRNEIDFEYNAPYWHLRVFGATGNNQYEERQSLFFFDLDTDNFNALTVANVDDDPEDELLFSTFPRTYIFEHNGSKLAPTWFHYGGLTTHHWVGDVNGNGTPEFALGRGDKALFWEKDVNYNGPDVVSDLTAYGPSPAQVQLCWTAASNADSYRIWRGEINGGSIFIEAIDSSAQLDYLDQNLTNGQTYLYLIESKAPALNPIFSPFSNAAVVTPDVLGRLDSVVAVDVRHALAHFSVPVQATAEQIPHFRLNGNTVPATLISSGDLNQTILLGFEEEFLATNTLTIDSTFLDRDARRLDPLGRQASFSYVEDTTQQAHFTKWTVLNGSQARIWFNFSMDTSVLNLSRYEVAPLGRVAAVEFFEGDPNSVLVSVEGVTLGSLGYPVSITLNGGSALNGAFMRTDAGNVATFSSFQEDLSQVYVYPNPYQGNDFFEGIRFANLSRQCTVTVYTASGRLIAQFVENDGDGGVEWDLRNTKGERIVPGNYLYRVESEGLEPFVGTFSILQ